MSEWIRTEQRLPERPGLYKVQKSLLSTGRTVEDECEFWPRAGQKRNVWKNAAGMVITTVVAWKENRA